MRTEIEIRVVKALLGAFGGVLCLDVEQTIESKGFVVANVLDNEMSISIDDLEDEILICCDFMDWEQNKKRSEIFEYVYSDFNDIRSVVKGFLVDFTDFKGFEIEEEVEEESKYYIVGAWENTMSSNRTFNNEQIEILSKNNELKIAA
ncbi:hypothetical protein EV201_1288 [Ancylomarina subtilis]|uniref:Uncharacterized protein n=1 Tax=Ancylomarina subtilis TaxID=1639035 RepID=A0A4Q7VKM7_9BACT|nr:hypothetical protein [Ancylomarina subtilis]RZT96647.1 hypothetical protein EV201_1288 [Ancylomarina subtilis]